MEPKLKVLFVGSFLSQAKNNDATGGVMKVSRELIASKLSDSVDWVLVDSTALSIPPPPVRVRLGLAFQRIKKLVTSLIWDDVDVVLIFSSSGFSFLEKGLMTFLSKGLNKPVVFCPRSGTIIDSVENSKWMKKYVEYVLKSSGAIMCQGKSWKDFYQNLTGLPDENFEVIPNWINLNEMPLPLEKEETDSEIRILYLGWLKAYKGIFDLLDAIVELNQEIDLSQVKFVVAGSGEDHEKVVEVIQKYQIEHLFDMRGWVVGERKTEALQSSDIYVHPSHTEGLPNSLLEAMAMGMAPIGTSVGAIPEVLCNPEHGLLIPPHDSRAIKEALKILILDKEKRLAIGKNARRYIEENHDIGVIWPRIYKLFKRLAEKQK